MSRRVYFLVVLIALAGLTARGEHGKTSPPRVVESRDPGEILFTNQCLNCHGLDVPAEKGSAGHRIKLFDRAIAIAEPTGFFSDLTHRAREVTVDKYMPPSYLDKDPLTKDERELLVRWLGTRAEARQKAEAEMKARLAKLAKGDKMKFRRLGDKADVVGEFEKILTPEEFGPDGVRVKIGKEVVNIPLEQMDVLYP